MPSLLGTRANEDDHPGGGRSCVRQVQQIGHGDGDWFTQVNNNILLFDRQDHPFVPTCLPAEHRAQRQSRMPPANAAAPAQPARRVLDRARTVLG